jgi:hypothetical protein
MANVYEYVSDWHVERRNRFTCGPIIAFCRWSGAVGLDKSARPSSQTDIIRSLLCFAYSLRLPPRLLSLTLLLSKSQLRYGDDILSLESDIWPERMDVHLVRYRV